MTKATAEYIATLTATNPCVALDGDNYRTCPVRMSFPDLFRPGKAMEEGKDPKFSLTCLFQTGADVSLLKQAASRCAAAKWGDAAGKMKLKTPFRDQGDKDQFEGYVAGNVFLTATSKNKPMVYLPNRQVVQDESRVYPGAWALAIIRPFAYDAGLSKGVSFGLQSVIVVADDEAFGNSGPRDADADFSGVNVGPVSGGGTGGAAVDASSLF